MAFPSGWARKQKITIQAANVNGSGSHIDFPMLITQDHLNTKIIDAGLNSALNGGGDIRFSSDAAGSVQLPCDIVTFITNAAAASRKCEIWLKIPNLSTTINTEIYIWYNKAAEVQPLASHIYGRNAVWSDYKTVAHLTDGANTTVGGYIDATGNNDGTGISMALANVTGPFDSMVAQFDGSADYVDFPISLIASDDIFTIQAWGKCDNLSVDQRLVSLFSDSAINHSSQIIWMDQGGGGNGWRAQVKNAAPNTYTAGAPSANNATTNWQFLHNVYNSSNNILYLDGANIASTSGSGNFSDGTGDAITFVIGNIWHLIASNTDFFDGAVAEARLRFSILSADWIATEYNNQNAAAAFAIAGIPQLTATNINLSVMAAAHAHNTDNITLIQNYDLFIAPSDHAHSTTNFALLQFINLNITASGHFLSSAALDITEHKILGLNESVLQISSDDLTFETLSLMISPCVHILLNNGLNLGYDVNLMVDNAPLKTFSNNILMNQNHVLAIAGVNQTILSDQISANIIIAGEPVDHSLLSDEPLIFQNHNLDLSNIFHKQFSAAPHVRISAGIWLENSKNSIAWTTAATKVNSWQTQSPANDGWIKD